MEVRYDRRRHLIYIYAAVSWILGGLLPAAWFHRPELRDWPEAARNAVETGIATAVALALVLGAAFLAFTRRKQPPALIIDSNGITFGAKEIGLIPWRRINTVETWRRGGSYYIGVETSRTKPKLKGIGPALGGFGFRKTADGVRVGVVLSRLDKSEAEILDAARRLRPVAAAASA